MTGTDDYPVPDDLPHLGRLILIGPDDDLVAWCRVEFGVEVDTPAVRRLARAMVDLYRAYAVANAKSVGPVPEDVWRGAEVAVPWPTDPGCWRMWLKKRLEEAGAFPHAGNEYCGRLDVILHMGYLSLLETAEQLSRLRNEPVGVTEGGTARSKIFTSPLVPHPIDSTAARVAPETKDDSE